MSSATGPLLGALTVESVRAGNGTRSWGGGTMVHDVEVESSFSSRFRQGKSEVAPTGVRIPKERDLYDALPPPPSNAQ